MSFNALTSRSDAAIPTKVVNQIFESLKHESLVMRSFTSVPMTTGSETMKIIDLLPFSFWQNATDTGLGQTSRAAWANKTITAEKLMCFIPIPRSVLEDSEIDIFATVLPKIVESMAFEIDRTCLFGTNAPVSFPTSLYAQAVAASSNFTANTSAANGGISEDINKAYEAITKNGGYRPTHILGGFSLDSKILRARDTTGQRLADFNGVNDWNGVPILKGSDALFTGASGQPIAMMIASKQIVVGLRQDIQIKVMEEAVITDNNGVVIFNCGQADLVCLRVTFRMGWQVAGEANINNTRQGTNEVQTLTQNGSVSSGTQTLTFDGKSATVPYNETAANVQTALEGLVNIGVGNVSVARSGSSGSYVYTVTFQNALGGTNVSQMTATSTAGSIAAATTTAGAAGARTVCSVLVAP